MCERQSADLTVPVVAAVGLAVAAGVAWFAVTYAAVLAVGGAGVVACVAAMQAVLRRHVVLCHPGRPPVRQRPRAAAERVLEGTVVRELSGEVRALPAADRVVRVRWPGVPGVDAYGAGVRGALVRREGPAGAEPDAG